MPKFSNYRIINIYIDVLRGIPMCNSKYSGRGNSTVWDYSRTRNRLPSFSYSKELTSSFVVTPLSSELLTKPWVNWIRDKYSIDYLRALFSPPQPFNSWLSFYGMWRWVIISRFSTLRHEPTQSSSIRNVAIPSRIMFTYRNRRLKKTYFMFWQYKKCFLPSNLPIYILINSRVH